MATRRFISQWYRKGKACKDCVTTASPDQRTHQPNKKTLQLIACGRHAGKSLFVLLALQRMGTEGFRDGGQVFAGRIGDIPFAPQGKTGDIERLKQATHAIEGKRVL